MKRIFILVLTGFMLNLCFVGIGFSEDEDDILTIKKAVKENPAYKPGAEIRWFKLQVTDVSTKKVKVKITVPIILINLIFDNLDSKNVKIDNGKRSLDIQEIFMELKKAGPMALIEISGEKELVKIWFE